MASVTRRGGATGTTTSGTTWASTANAYDAGSATYATWTNAARSTVGYIEIGSYDFSSIPAGSTINSVSVTLRHMESNTTVLASVVFGAYISGSAVGTQTTAIRATAARTDTGTPTLTLAQLQDANLRFRVTATRSNSTTNTVFSVDYIEVTVDYTAPVAPTSASITATSKSSSGIALTWTGNNSPTNYLVERSDDGSTGWTTLYNGAATSYLDEGITASTTKYYRVTASNSVGSFTSSVSNAATNAKATISSGNSLLSETFTAANGSSWPAGWTLETSASYDIQSNSGRILPSGDYSDERSSPTAGNSHTDIELLFRMRCVANPGNTYAEVSLRTQGTVTSPTDRYLVEFDPTSVYIGHVLSGAHTYTSRDNSQTLTDPQIWKWVRFRAEGSTLSYKVWTDGNAEPGTWTHSYTHTSLTSGFVHVKFSSPLASPADFRIDDFSLVELTTGVTVSPTGYTDTTSVGSPSISTTVTISPNGVVDASSNGTPSLTTAITLNPTGLIDGTSVGTPSVTLGAVTVSPTGVSDGSVIGSPTIDNGGVPATTVNPNGVSGTGAIGAVSITTAVTLSPTGVGASTAIGVVTVTANVTLSPGGVVGADSVGTPGITLPPLVISPVGVSDSSAVGSPTIAMGGLTVSPVGISLVEAIGSPTISLGALTVSPGGIASAESVGSPTVVLSTGAQTVNPTGVSAGTTKKITYIFD